MKKKCLGENKIWKIVNKRKAIEKRILIFKQILKVKNEEKYRKVKIQKLQTKIHGKYEKQ